MVTLSKSRKNILAPKFLDMKYPFFNPEDRIQVKYEMLRQVLVEGTEVNKTAREFGFSRPRFYQLKERFEQEGMAGLIDGIPGRKEATKITPQILAFILEQKRIHPELSGKAIRDKITKTFGLRLGQRTVERALQEQYIIQVKKNE